MFQKNFTECLFPPEEVSDQQQMETSIQHNPVDSSGSLKDGENNCEGRRFVWDFRTFVVPDGEGIKCQLS